jgi:hypothetical protein
MDTSDPAITFDAAGVCNHCQRFETVLRPRWRPGPEGRARLEAAVAKIRRECANRDYDCILGLSGGVDSSWLAVQIKSLGLRPLVVHVDCGWNTEAAVQNIEHLVKTLGFDLHTIVIDWEEMRDLQLYRFAIKHGVRWVISGGNLASESVLPVAWGHDAMDARQLRAVHRRFGTRPLKTYPIADFFDLYFRFPCIHRMQVLRPLDFLPYDKVSAKRALIERHGWKDYGAKHHESVWTKFFQGHILPVRWGFDKRHAHLSSLILAGQISRPEACLELERPAYSDTELRRDQTFVLKKLGLTEPEFTAIMQAPKRHPHDYPNNRRLRRLWLPLLSKLRRAPI